MKFTEMILEQIDEKVLIMTIGISGSGKSTYLSKHYPKNLVVSADQLRIDYFNNVTETKEKRNAFLWYKVMELAGEKLNKFGKAIIDMVNVKSVDRKRILKQFPEVTKKIAIVFKPNLEESWKRIQNDLKSGKNRSNVKREILERQLENYNNGLQNIEKQFDEVIYVN